LVDNLGGVNTSDIEVNPETLAGKAGEPAPSGAGDAASCWPA
jgi:hypothetical protein